MGYEDYSKSLEVPAHLDYGDPSSDDLSSEWDTDSEQNEERQGILQHKHKKSKWRMIRSIVHITPFFQVYKDKNYPWVQLGGHQGNFKKGRAQGTILKKFAATEQAAFERLMKEQLLRPFVPDYHGLLKDKDGEEYIELQDLLLQFENPSVMDCKIGLRTYLEDELIRAKEKPKLRKDMYEKMCQIDPSAPTPEEHLVRGVTKPRYMAWRETVSTTSTMAFRIEGMRIDGASTNDFKATTSREIILEAFTTFLEACPSSAAILMDKLMQLKDALVKSEFFWSHEMIGSSLLFVHDSKGASVWMIDFAKTIPLPDGIKITHDKPWSQGNHEDGYLIGLSNLISIFADVQLKNQI